MNKLLYFFGFLILSIFIFAGVAGENNRVDVLVSNYFKDVLTGNYSFLCKDEPAENLSQCQNELFLMEIAFLNRFNITDGEAFEVFTRKNIFWIPLTGSNEIGVDARLHPASDCSKFFCINGRYNEDYAKNVFKFIRKSGKWELSGLSFNDEGLKQHYLNVKRRVDFNKYVERTDKGSIIKHIDVDAERNDPLSYKLLLYSLKIVLQENKK